MALASSSFSTRMWRALYSLPLLAATNLSYSALISASVTGLLLLEVGEQLADQDGLAGQFHLALEVGRGFQAALLGFLHEDFAGDDFFLDLTFHLGGERTAGALHLLLELFDALGRNGLAVHDGKVLGMHGQGHGAQQGSGHEAGQELFLHSSSVKEKVFRREMGGLSDDFDGDGVCATVNEILAAHHTQGDAGATRVKPVNKGDAIRTRKWVPKPVPLAPGWPSCCPRFRPAPPRWWAGVSQPAVRSSMSGAVMAWVFMPGAPLRLSVSLM
jgi:hypothetical protein